MMQLKMNPNLQRHYPGDHRQRYYQGNSHRMPVLTLILGVGIAKIRKGFESHRLRKLQRQLLLLLIAP
jgi:hypothetical protein